MMVLFVSQCEKKALAKTRRVLDAFADRIGDNTWQTLITMEGLKAVHKLLRKTVTKNTAVSCHWIRTRSRSELVWIVGNKRKFNKKGIVPVNYTELDLDQFMDSGKWQTLPIIRSAASIAALFHDFGKASQLFQKKLKGETKKNYEPVRHEWVSLRVFQAFVGEKNDENWLIGLTETNKDHFDEFFKDGLTPGLNHPLRSLPPFAELVAWLIFSHHKLPVLPFWNKDHPSESIPSSNDKNLDLKKNWFDRGLSVEWNSYNFRDPDVVDSLEENWSLESNALPYQSYKWRSEASNAAGKALACINSLSSESILHNDIFTSHISRLILMLSDHYYSSQEEVSEEWRSPYYEVFANTYKTRELKQQLDEHLIGVSTNARKITSALPKFKSSLEGLENNAFLENKRVSNEKYAWQIASQKLIEKNKHSTTKQGFFGINMASTGTGKTLANAKIIYALKEENDSSRFTVALGLRTLTLQTGQEYRKELSLDDSELAILIGGIATQNLFEKDQSKLNPQEDFGTGSESERNVLDPAIQVDFDLTPTEHSLSEWTKHDPLIEKIVQAPVVVCTIDHLVPATEGIKGGRQIGPMLRLLTSDLIIDEPDDFSLEDLPALCRLVYWSAMLGGRVLLSTATMPPDLAFAAFQAYERGWGEYAKTNVLNWNKKINCAWFDERKNKAIVTEIAKFEEFKSCHEKYVSKRIHFLKETQKAKHKARILENDTSFSNLYQGFAETIMRGALELHSNNFSLLKEKKISLGLVRMANITPMVEVVKEFLKLEVPEQTHIHLCVYHGSYPLAIRSYLESQLDSILKRKENWPPESLLNTVEGTDKKEQIFIIFASPVAEVGRDHDYDWAIIEPSSMRSIIQVSGRVLRHRDKLPKGKNIFLIDRNIKQLKGSKRCFVKPGFEMENLGLKMDYHHLKNGVLNEEQYETINSSERIARKNNNHSSNLVALEHKALLEQLFADKNRCAKLWWKQQVHWCGVIQKKQPFRKKTREEAFYLTVENERLSWRWKNEAVFPPRVGTLSGSGFEIKEREVLLDNNSFSFIFKLEPFSVYKELANNLESDVEKVSRKYGEIRLPSYTRNDLEQYFYSVNFGVYKEV